VVKGLEPVEPGRSRALLEQMLRRCHARTVGPVVCLRTLANAGAPEGLAYARSALLHPAPLVRGTATEALRTMPGAEVDGLLDQVLLGDPSARVRALAVAAISQRVAGPHLRAVAMALRAESSEQVRLEVVRMLGGWKAVDEVAAALLRDAADNDASERVRRLAATLLAG
jgi:HEAT repeat protein